MWAVLILAMVVPKANRTRGVLAILVPVLLVYLAWLVLALILKPSTSDREQFSLLVLSLAVGMAALWLLGHWLARRRWFVSLLSAIAIAAGVILLGMLSFGLDGPTTAQVALMLGILMLVTILAYALAGRVCHRRYGPVRFIVPLAVGMVAFSVGGMALFFVIWCAIAGSWPSHPLSILLETGVVGLVVGGCIFLISLPFVLVGLRSPLFRPRLFACLRLGPGPVAPAGTAPAPGGPAPGESGPLPSQ